MEEARKDNSNMFSIKIICLLIASWIVVGQGEISCSFSRSTKKVKCGSVECSANTDNTPVGTYKVGAVEWNSGKEKFWVNLYPRKASGSGYWDYYCENPDSGRSKIALHPGSVSLGCISVPDAVCWSKLEAALRNERTTSLSVTGVERSGVSWLTTFSCSGGLAAGAQVTKTVSIVGSLQVVN